MSLPHLLDALYRKTTALLLPFLYMNCHLFNYSKAGILYTHKIKRNKNKFLSTSPCLSCLLQLYHSEKYCLNVACGLTSIHELLTTIQSTMKKHSQCNIKSLLKHLATLPSLFIHCPRKIYCER